MIRRMRIRALTSALIAASALHATAARADDPSLEELLDQSVVSTASDNAESQSTAPATSTVITADDLRRYGIHSLDEAINFLSLGMVAQNPLHSVEVGSRGVLMTADFGNHVLLLINGHEMNEEWDGTAYFERGAGVPFELIDHIEVILGPGSVLYGSNAMLGVINVVTKRAKDYKGAHFILEGGMSCPAFGTGSSQPGFKNCFEGSKYGLTSGRISAGFGAEFDFLGKPAEITTQLEYYTQDGPHFTFPLQNVGTDSVTGQPQAFTHGVNNGIWGGTARNSYRTQIPSGVMRIGWGDFDLTIHAETYKRSTPYQNNFNIYYTDFDDPATYETDRFFNIDLKHEWQISKLFELRSRLYLDSYDYISPLQVSAASDCLDGQTNGCYHTELGISRWAGVQEQGWFDWLHNGRLMTMLGADIRGRWVAQKEDSWDWPGPPYGPSRPAGSVGVHSVYEEAAAVFVQQEATPTKWLGLNAGLRFDQDQRFGTKFSPRVAATAKVWNGGSFKGVYSEAFRSPTFYEEFYTDGVAQIASRDASNIGLVPKFKPETVRSVEGSFEQRFGTHRLLWGAFSSWWFNMSQQLPIADGQIPAAIAAGLVPAGTTDAPVVYQNVGTIKNYGFNALYEGSSLNKTLRYGLNLTGAFSRIEQSGTQSLPVTVTPSVFGNARASYDLPGQWPVVALIGQLQGRRLADQAFNGGFTPLASTPVGADIRATISGPMPGVKGLTYRLSSDYNFVSHSPYVAGPLQAATATQPYATLAPVDQFVTMLGLQYDIDHF